MHAIAQNLLASLSLQNDGPAFPSTISFPQVKCVPHCSHLLSSTSLQWWSYSNSFLHQQL
ncbi:hypothetical protein HanPSC8_Chr06g0265801 [Helianthus annuus]|nr:hypothetical protein HanPSC8_Chr06g0265801 [Helianthus annuus]